MNDDELRNRLARLDPQADAPVDPITSPRAQDLLERTMTSTQTPAETVDIHEPRRNRMLMALAAGVAAAGLVTAVVLTQGGGTPAPAKKTTLALHLPGGSPGGPITSGSCIRFDVSILKDFPLAFAGTATSVGGDSVTLDVTHWYKGGTAQQVTLANGGGVTSVQGVTFAVGTKYLVSANDGTVISCGYTGEATAELQQAYDHAFG